MRSTSTFEDSTYRPNKKARRGSWAQAGFSYQRFLIKIPAITYSRTPQGTTIGGTGLTTEFGMGSGVSLPLSSPENQKLTELSNGFRTHPPDPQRVREKDFPALSG